jgi:hypothetical protein
MDAPARAKTSAPYGHACMNCVKAKVRCMVRDEAGCERSVLVGDIWCIVCLARASVNHRDVLSGACTDRFTDVDALAKNVSLRRPLARAMAREPHRNVHSWRINLKTWFHCFERNTRLHSTIL